MQEITKLSLSEHLTSPVIFLQHFTQSSPRQMSSAGRRLDTKSKLFVYSAPTAVDQVASSLSLFRLRSATLLVSDEEKLLKLTGFVKCSLKSKFDFYCFL